MKVLVVDDHAYNRELLGFILEDHEHDVVYAEDGKIACECVEQDPEITLVLMDVMMPIMDGLEATRRIKEKLSDRFLPILFVTALDNEKNITDCLEAGGDDFVPKPVNENILLAKLNAHVRSKALYDKLKVVNNELTYYRKSIDREHAIVEHIFKNGSDRVKTICENIDSYTSPMSMFNGDLVLVAPSPSGGAYGLVGDFTGHGLAASIGSLPVTEVFFHNVNRQASISQLARDLNERLKLLLPSNMFFCAAIFELDRMGESMTLWMGGMNDIIALSADRSRIEKIESEHMPLGILDDAEFDDSPSVIAIDKFHELFIYTDGITEAQNSDHEEFGEDRLSDMVLQNSTDPIKEIVEAVGDFTMDSGQGDDVSIVRVVPGNIVHRSKEDNSVVDVGEAYHQVDSVPWNLSVELRDEELRSTSVVDQVMSFVSSIKGIELHQDKIFTIVSELYNNSLEHGVLRLSSGLKQDADGFERYYKLREERLANLSGQHINIQFNYIHASPNKLELIIEDSGDGFDSCELKKKVDSDDESHGRGMQLLNHLCASLDYDAGGRRVRAVYELRQH